jgi:hypothetical protein
MAIKRSDSKKDQQQERFTKSKDKSNDLEIALHFPIGDCATELSFFPFACGCEMVNKDIAKKISCGF